MLGTLGILIMVGFFVLCAIRMVPVYMDYLSVNSIIQNIATEPETRDMDRRDIKRRIGNIFNSNQISGLTAKEVQVIRKRGKTYIDARYEKRLPIAWRIDAVLSFDDLIYEVGSAEPVTDIPQ